MQSRAGLLPLVVSKRPYRPVGDSPPPVGRPQRLSHRLCVVQILLRRESVGFSRDLLPVASVGILVDLLLGRRVEPGSVGFLLPRAQSPVVQFAGAIRFTPYHGAVLVGPS